MKRFLQKIAIYGGLSLVLFNLIALVSLHFLGRSQFYKPQFISNGTPRQTYDYTILGSSTGLTTLDSRQIDSITGLNGINISMDDTSAPSHFLMLQHFLAEGHRTKKLVLSILPWDAEIKQPKLGKNDYRFLTYISRDYIYNYYAALEQEYFKPLTLSRYLPILGVSSYNTELFYPSAVAAAKPHYHNRFDDRGNYSYPQSGGGAWSAAKKTNAFYLKNPYLKKIAALCKEQDIELIYYLSPVSGEKFVPASKENFVNHSGLLTDGKLFYDRIHVNDAGRKVCSAALAEVLKTN